MPSLLENIEMLDELCKQATSNPELLHEHIEVLNQILTDFNSNGVKNTYWIEYAIKQSLMLDHKTAGKELNHGKLMEDEAQVYVIKTAKSGIYKIGVTTNLDYRIRQLQNFHHEQLILVAAGKGGRKTEVKLHQKMAGSVVKGEWFQLGESELEEVKKILEGGDV